MSTTDSKILAHYVRNVDETHGTEVIKFNDDDRPDLVIGGVGYVTKSELGLAPAAGAVLEPITIAEAKEQNLILPEGADITPLEDLTDDELKELAAEEGIDLKGKSSKAAKIEAINESRSKQEEGRASLPATATGSGGGPTLGGGAAGPDGAPAAGPAGT